MYTFSCSTLSHTHIHTYIRIHTHTSLVQCCMGSPSLSLSLSRSPVSFLSFSPSLLLFLLFLALPMYAYTCRQPPLPPQRVAWRGRDFSRHSVQAARRSRHPRRRARPLEHTRRSVELCKLALLTAASSTLEPVHTLQRVRRKRESVCVCE